MQHYIKALQDYCKQNLPNLGNAKSAFCGAQRQLVRWPTAAERR